jgi:hypothetical protein
MEASPSPLSSRAQSRDLRFYRLVLEMFFDGAKDLFVVFYQGKPRLAIIYQVSVIANRFEMRASTKNSQLPQPNGPSSMDPGFL